MSAVQPLEVERIVVDVYVRQGRSIDIADEAQDIGEFVPQAPAAPPAEGETSPPARLEDAQPIEGALPPEDAATRRDQKSEADREHRAEAALALGGTFVVPSAPGRRAARIARGARSSRGRRWTKVGRLLRQVR